MTNASCLMTKFISCPNKRTPKKNKQTRRLTHDTFQFSSRLTSCWSLLVDRIKSSWTEENLPTTTLLRESRGVRVDCFILSVIKSRNWIIYLMFSRSSSSMCEDNFLAQCVRLYGQVTPACLKGEGKTELVCDSYREGNNSILILDCNSMFRTSIISLREVNFRKTFLFFCFVSSGTSQNFLAAHYWHRSQNGFFLSRSIAKQKNKVNFVTNDRLSIDTTIHAGPFSRERSSTTPCIFVLSQRQW